LNGGRIDPAKMAGVALESETVVARNSRRRANVRGRTDRWENVKAGGAHGTQTHQHRFSQDERILSWQRRRGLCADGATPPIETEPRPQSPGRRLTSEPRPLLAA